MIGPEKQNNPPDFPVPADALDSRADMKLILPYYVRAQTIDVEIQDASYETYISMLYWLFTGFVECHDLGSLKTKAPTDATPPPKSFQYGLVRFKSRSPGSCCPKALYILAIEYGLPDLQSIALEGILSFLTPENIVSEIFSEFSGKHPRVAQHLGDYLITNWNTVKTSETLRNFPLNIANGRLEVKTQVHQLAWERIWINASK